MIERIAGMVKGGLLGAGVAGAVALVAAATAHSFAPPAPKPAPAAAAPAKPKPSAPKPAALAKSPAEEPFVVRRILPIDGKPFRHGDWYWDEKGAPATGPIVVTVDRKAQVLSVFRAGYEIGTAVILYGADNTPTPVGVFPITEKDADHVSNLYDAPMPYMLRMTNDGVSIHGSNVQIGYATHGCVGVPIPFAKLLFEHVKLGDRVIVTESKTIGMGDPIIAR
ncbi:L,D-transpeptidase family protein [Sphingomonas cannabina]|uniref:L,D-transpeptidase family protein n=1 Tax=Sphingomonas cannabina TaxID=2899123 RepID=UPI001F03198A|nr:L,D-transpeptidase family protein [Sphingomonas cannabina]UIJ46122.1 L,D-transpeptidase family protein [Sphingomonas cannabina]